MAKGKKRIKAMAARAKRKEHKFASYKRVGETPSDETNYGKRWHARRRGAGMANRSNENKPWYHPSWGGKKDESGFWP